jgi:hypothetical protein
VRAARREGLRAITDDESETISTARRAPELELELEHIVTVAAAEAWTPQVLAARSDRMVEAVIGALQLPP